MPRIPGQCQPAFQGRYTVQPGDTFYRISQIFRVRLEALAVNNSHITDPNILFPGDILCVPGLIAFPCCTILQPHVPVPFGSSGTAAVVFAPRGGQAVSFMAVLPQPSTFGDYDIYTGDIFIQNIGDFGNQLFPTPEDPPTWSSRVELPTVASVQPNSQALIRPFNSLSGITGPVVLEGVFRAGACMF